jgi:hypothetical protein
MFHIVLHEGLPVDPVAGGTDGRLRIAEFTAVRTIRRVAQPLLE